MWPHAAPPPRGPPPALNAGGFGAPPPQQQRSAGEEDSLGGDDSYGDDEGALGATINLVTSAATMFFNPGAPRPQAQAQPQAPPAQQQAPPRNRGPPPPINPSSSMLDMEPSQPQPPIAAQQPPPPAQQAFQHQRQAPQNKPRLNVETLNNGGPPMGGRSLPPTPTATSTQSPRIMMSHSYDSGDRPPPRIPVSQLNPARSQPPTPTLQQAQQPVESSTGSSAAAAAAAAGNVAPKIPPIQVRGSAPPTPVRSSAPPTPIASGRGQISSAPPTPDFKVAAGAEGFFAQESIEGLPKQQLHASQAPPISFPKAPSQPPTPTLQQRCPPKPTFQQQIEHQAATLRTPLVSATLQPVSFAGEQPLAPTLQTQTLETIHLSSVAAAAGPPFLPSMQRFTPPPSPARRMEHPPTPVTPQMTNQTQSLKMIHTPKSLDTRRKLRPPPAAQISPRNSNRPKFRLPPARNPKVAPLIPAAVQKAAETKLATTAPKIETPSSVARTNEQVPEKTIREQVELVPKAEGLLNEPEQNSAPAKAMIEAAVPTSALEMIPMSLPEGWTETVDPTSARSYFFNAITQETSWERPQMQKVNVEAGSQDVAADEPYLAVQEKNKESTADDQSNLTASNSLGEGWTETIDSSSGRPYFYNSLTQETSWERPNGDLPSSVKLTLEDAQVPEENQAAPKESVDSLTYLTNGVDNTDAEQEDATQPETQIFETNTASLPEGWTEAVDQSTGQTYYYNSVTQETAWERPAEEEPERIQVTADEVDASALKVEEKDPDSGVVDVTKKANEEQDDAAISRGEEQAPSDEQQSNLPYGWIEGADPSTGKKYYFNSVTQETSWERPAGGGSEAIEETIADEGEASTSQDKDFVEPEHGNEVSPKQMNGRTEEKAAWTGVENAPEETQISNLPEGWTEAVDPSTGMTYYYNSNTQVTSWERPVGEEPERVEAEAAKDEEGEAVVEPEPGSESDDTDGTGSISTAEGEATEETQQPSLPEGWTEAEDPTSGQIYYYNSITQETSWERPAGEEPESIYNAVTEEEGEGVHGSESAEAESDGEAETISAEESILPEQTQQTSLPEGWTEAEDPSTGQFYYYNSITQETSWERPAGEDPERIYNAATREEEEAVAESVERESDCEVTDVSTKSNEEEETAISTGEEQGLEETQKESLPEGWTEVVDPSTGLTYYYNSNTQVTSWERPAGEEPEHIANAAVGEEGESTTLQVEDSVERELESEVTVTDEAVDVSAVDEQDADNLQQLSLPEGWTETMDPSSGQTYYFNSMTQETSWGRPMTDEPETVVEPPVSSKNDGVVDGESNKAPEETSAEISPYGATDVPSTYGSTPAEDAGKLEVRRVTSFSLPECWLEESDPQTGQVYYFNSVTQETTWKRPEEDDDELAADLPVSSSGNNEDGRSTEQEPENAVERDEQVTEAITEAQVTMSTGPEEPELEIDMADEQMEDENPQSELPPGWTELIDTASGLPYYLHEVDDTTTWERPVTDSSPPIESHTPGVVTVNDVELMDEKQIPECNGVSNDRVHSDGGEIATPKEETLLDGWVQLVDPSSGEAYYFNENDGSTTWVRPSAYFPEHPETVVSSIDGGKPEEDRPGDYINDGAGDDGQTSEPIEADDSPDGAAGSQTFEQENGDDTLPDGWVELVDPTSGNTYYFNEISGESAWDRPSAAGQGGMLDSSEPEEERPERAPEMNGQDAVEESPEGTDEVTGEQDLAEVVENITSSELPSDTIAEEISPDEVLTKQEATQDENILLPGWIELIDPTSGNAYYFNENDNSTAWERPVSVLAADNAEEEEEATCVDDYKNKPEEERPSKDPDLIIESVAAEDGEGPAADEPKYSQENSNGQRPGNDLDEQEYLPPGWTEHVDPSSGDVFYSNETENITAWERPTSQANEKNADPPESVEPATVNTKTLGGETKKGLPPGWEEVIDPSSGDKYYFNSETNTTSWDPPESTDTSGEPAHDSTSHESEGQNVAPLQQGWVELVDPSSGQTFYSNEEENQTSWDRPVDTSSEAKSFAARAPKETKDRQRPAHAIAAFGFGGRLCTWSPQLEGGPNEVQISRVNQTVVDSIVRIEESKRQSSIFGPLNSSDDSFALSYIERKVEHNPEDLLWQLILIAAKSKGRLRSDEGVGDNFGPEASIVELLLRDGEGPHINGKSKGSKEVSSLEKGKNLHTFPRLCNNCLSHTYNVTNA
jgi:hypothetical protein